MRPTSGSEQPQPRWWLPAPTGQGLRFELPDEADILMRALRD